MKRHTFSFGSIAAAAAILAVAAGTTYSVVHRSVPVHVPVANTLGTRQAHPESANNFVQADHPAIPNTDNTDSRNSIANSAATPVKTKDNSNSTSKNATVSKVSAGAVPKPAVGTNTASHAGGNGTGAAGSSTPPAQSTSTTTPSPPVQIPPNAATGEQVIKGVTSTLGGLATSPPTGDPSAKYVTLTDADHMILTALEANASATAYEVGGTPLAWGDAMGINAGITDQILTQTDLATLLQNLSYLGNRYKTLSSGTYQLGYFLTGSYFVGSKAPPAQAKSDQATAVQWFDSITVTVKDGVMTVSIPSLSMNNSCYFLVQGMNSGVTYSLDSGSTWTSLPYAYQSKEPSQGGLAAPPARILFKFTQFDSSHPIDVEFYTPYETATPLIGALLSYDRQNGFQV